MGQPAACLFSPPPAHALHSWTRSQGPVCRGAGPLASTECSPLSANRPHPQACPGCRKGLRYSEGLKREGERRGAGEESKKGLKGEGGIQTPGSAVKDSLDRGGGWGQRNIITKK